MLGNILWKRFVETCLTRQVTAEKQVTSNGSNIVNIVPREA